MTFISPQGYPLEDVDAEVMVQFSKQSHWCHKSQGQFVDLVCEMKPLLADAFFIDFICFFQLMLFLFFLPW